jgi:hypothetical protein
MRSIKMLSPHKQNKVDRLSLSVFKYSIDKNAVIPRKTKRKFDEFDFSTYCS